MKRLVDSDELWALFVDHYWNGVQKDRDLILCHITAVMTAQLNMKEVKNEPLR